MWCHHGDDKVDQRHIEGVKAEQSSCHYASLGDKYNQHQIVVMKGYTVRTHVYIICNYGNRSLPISFLLTKMLSECCNV